MIEWVVEVEIHRGRIVADREKCRGYGNCLTADPSHFDLDDNGKVEVLNDVVTERSRELVDRAVRSCPVQALEVRAD